MRPVQALPARTIGIDVSEDRFHKDAPLKDCPDTARQEFAKEADANYVLSRFGIQPGQRPLTYEEVDWDVDLQQALASIANARRGFNKLPPSLKTKYGSWLGLLSALDTATLKGDLEQLINPTPPAPVSN